MLEEKIDNNPPQQVKIIENKLYGRKLESYEFNKKTGIPVLIEMLIIRLYSTQRFLKAEGIMRKSCDV